MNRQQKHVNAPLQNLNNSNEIISSVNGARQFNEFNWAKDQTIKRRAGAYPIAVCCALKP